MQRHSCPDSYLRICEISSISISKKKNRILHQHRVWERNDQNCAANLQIIFGFCKFFMHKVKFLTYFGIYIAYICYIISQYMLNRATLPIALHIVPLIVLSFSD